MRTLRFFLFLLVAGTAPVMAAESSTFGELAGHYALHGSVTLKQSGATLGTGKATLQFAVSKSGEVARLTVSGRLRINGATRPFTETIIFGKDGLARVSDLAPGVEDGLSAEGTYSLVSPLRVTASLPFTIRTTSGVVSVLARVKKRARTAKLTVTHELQASTLISPLLWTFSGVQRR
jgi:hypothetical protein